MNRPFKLRDDLLLGVATASTQIEGGDINNNWYRWTKNGDKTHDGSNCLRANRHYEYYVEDIELMKKMGLETYRFSLEWSRIEPSEGEFSQEAMEHYIDEIKHLLAAGIKPLITLHHFSNPLWFEDKGAFLYKKNNHYFDEYVRFVGENLKDLAHEYCTINEPNVYAVNCYLFGEWVNEIKSLSKCCKVLKNLALCHINAYKILHQIDPLANVGFANHQQYFVPQRKHNLIDKIATHIYNQGFNDSITKAMGWGKFTWPIGCGLFSKKKGVFLDYIGLNYYTSNEVRGAKLIANPLHPKNDLGWAICPEGIAVLSKRLHDLFNKDVYITENGTCDHKDSFRSQYIYDHLAMIKDLPFVKRYYYWTFFDNFEWKEGEAICFGLIQYDYETEAKTPRKSCRFYEDIIKNKGITQDMLDTYIKKEGYVK